MPEIFQTIWEVCDLGVDIDIQDEFDVDLWQIVCDEVK
jgi:hypothetical protein